MDNYLWRVIKWMSGVFLFFGVSVLSTIMSWYILFPCFLFLVLLVIMVIRYKWGMYLLLFILPISPRTIGVIIKTDFNPTMHHVTFFDIIPIYAPFIILFFLGFMLNRFAETRKDLPKDPLWLPIWLLIAYAFLTLSWTSSIEHSMFTIFILGINLILYVLFSCSIGDNKIHKRIMWCWVISATLQGVITIAFYFFEHPKYHEFTFTYKILKEVVFNTIIPIGPRSGSGLLRRGTALSLPYETAFIMNLAIPIGLGLFLTETKRLRRWMLLIIILILVSANILTMSRAGLGSLIIMAFFLFITLERLRRHFFILFSAFLIVVILLFTLETKSLNLLYFREEFTPRLIYRVTKAGADVKKQMPDRLKWWKEGFHRLEDTCFIGMGAGNFLKYTKHPHHHNIYFSFLFDFGIVGLGVLFTIIIFLCKRLLSMLKHQISYIQIMCVAFVGGFIATGVQGVVDLGYDSQLIWLYLGMTVATLNLARQESLKNKPDHL